MYFPLHFVQGSFFTLFFYQLDSDTKVNCYGHKWISVFKELLKKYKTCAKNIKLKSAERRKICIHTHQYPSYTHTYMTIKWLREVQRYIETTQRLSIGATHEVVFQILDP